MKVYSTLSSAPLLPSHEPARNLACAEADRAADEQIRLYEAQVQFLLAELDRLRP